MPQATLLLAEIIWIRKLPYDFGIVLPGPIRLYCDNTSSAYMSTNPIHHDLNEHMAVDYHFVHERVAARVLVV